MSDVSLPTWLPLLGGLALKSLIIFACAGAALLALRRASASARHLVCLLTLAALTALPLLSLALPGWRLAVLSVSAPPAPNSGGAGEEAPVGARIIAPSFAVASPSRPHLSRPVSVPAPAPPELGAGGAAPRPFPWAIALPALWLAGILFAILRPLLGLWGITRLSRDSEPVADALTLALAWECASALGLSRTPVLRQADAPVPMTWGWRRPVVLLPTDAHGWPEDRLRAVLLHELAHVRRRDWLSHRFADLVCALYWFHPLVWLTARRLRAEGEIACDDLVLTSGVAAPDYARHLLDVARALRPASSAVPQAAIAMARTARLEGRLKMILDTTRSRRALSRRVLLLALGLSAAALVSLAILRPGAHALAAVPGIASSRRPVNAAKGTSVTLISRSSRSHTHLFHAARFAMLVSRPAARPILVSSSDLTIDGTRLLAGMTSANKQGSPWWSASGTPLPSSVYDTAAYRAEDHAGLDTNTVSFAFRLPAAAQDVTVQYDLPQGVRSSSDGFWPTKIRENAQRTEAQMFAKTNGARVLTAAFPPSLKRTSLRVGIAFGAWKTAATDTHDTLSEPAGYMSTNRDGSKFIFASPLEAKGDVVLTISTDATDDLRVVAVDAQGREILPEQIGGNSIGTLDQITAHFALPLSQIKAVRVETRPFQWVELKDIALRPTK